MQVADDDVQFLTDFADGLQILEDGDVGILLFADFCIVLVIVDVGEGVSFHHVADLVFIGHDEHDVLGGAGDASEDDGKAVAGIDGVDDVDGGIGTEFLPHILGDVVNGGVVTLRTGDDGLGDTDDRLVADFILVRGRLHGAQDAIDNDSSEVVTFPDDGTSETLRTNSCVFHLF